MICEFERLYQTVLQKNHGTVHAELLHELNLLEVFPVIMNNFNPEVDTIDINEPLPENGGYTLLMDIISSGKLEFVDFLVNIGADVNIVSDDGNFALAIASFLGYQDIFNYLQPLTSKELRQRSDGKWHNKKSLKALRRRNRLVIETLISAAKNNDTEQIEVAIRLGVDVNAVNPTSGEVAIHEACKRGNVEVVKALLEAGADVYHKLRDETPLSVARQANQTAVIQLLIANGAQTNPNQ
jgi:ankyrin repeat protein